MIRILALAAAGEGGGAGGVVAVARAQIIGQSRLGRDSLLKEAEGGNIQRFELLAQQGDLDALRGTGSLRLALQ